MTDSELLQLIEETSPEELAPEQIAELRRRATESPELRRALLESLRFEQWMGDGLGHGQVSAEKILHAADRVAGDQSRRWWLFTGGLVAVVVMVVSAISWFARAPAEPKSPPGATGLAQRNQVNESGNSDGQRNSSDTGDGKTSASTNENGSAATSLTDGDASPGVRPPTRPTAPAEQSRDWPELAPGAGINRPFDQVCFEDFGTRGLGVLQLQRWVEPVVGERQRIFDGPRGKVTTAGFEGLVKLKAPWLGDVVLRFTPFGQDSLTLHFWSGNDGVTLRYFHHQRHTWGAFVTRRDGANPRPSQYVFAGTDDGRFIRAASGTLEVRHQNGTLILSRGNVRLLVVPLDEPPTDVYLDRQAMFRGFTMYRGPSFPDEADPDRPVVLRADQPASLNWVTKLPEKTTFANRSDDAVDLRAEPDAELCWAAIPLPRAGLFEVTCLVENATPATGIFLGDAEGRPLHVVAFQRDSRTGQVGFGLRSLGDAAGEGRFDAPQEPAPVAGKQTWLRLVLGTASLKCWTSVDGEHWSRAVDPRRFATPQPYSHVGLFCARSSMGREITLRSCVVRELDGLTSLVDEGVVERVPDEVTKAVANLPAWLESVRSSRPADAEATVWQTACALRTLAAAPPALVARAILDDVLVNQVTSSLPLTNRLRMLDDAALLADTWSIGDCQQFLQHYERLARSLIQAGDTRPFTTLHAALLTAPIWCEVRFDATPAWLARHELVQLVSRDRWLEALALTNRLRFWNDSGRPGDLWPDNQRRLHDLVDWVAATSERRLPPDVNRPRDTTPLATSWRQPLVLEFSKEAYNTLSEVLAASAEKSYEDAGRLITTSSQFDRDLSGLIPDPQDEKLLVSYPRAIANLLLDTPDLQRSLIDRFGALGQLRLQEAIANDDEAAVRAVAMGFPGSIPAATAHQWLGDRSLAAGEFAAASREYRQVETKSEPSLAVAVQPRERLARAFLGQAVPGSIVEPVHWNDAVFSPADFEKLLADVLGRARNGGSAPMGSARSVSEGPSVTAMSEPSTVNVGRRLPWEAKQHEAGSVPGSNVDWIARQTAWAIASSTLITSNRQQVAAFDLSSGQPKWTHVGDVNASKSSRWPLVTSRPLVIGDRVLVRRLAKDGPLLVCLEAETGRVAWSTQPGAAVVSDPVVVDDTLRVVISVSVPQELLQLELVTLDLSTGEFSDHRPLVQFRDGWDRQISCQASATDNGLLIAAGGCVLRCDTNGDVVWLRRQAWIPASVDSASWEQSRDAPLTDGHRVLFTQPGVFGVDCVNAESGRLLWKRVFPELRRVVGLANGRLLVQTGETLQALDLNTSETVWQRDAVALLDAILIGQSPRVLLAEREPLPNGQSRPKLVWLDLSTGVELGTVSLDSLIDKQPCLSTFVGLPDRLWAIYGRGTMNPSRELLELIR
ncbi:MAG: PQQ-binding-like beta-propeller repeat protein [Planctomycetales bacterium]|nr:PQQ-binding-like beta-propeller repeat protein [Planctomycetales bacterium]